jgi:hypothetical protein
MAFLISLACAGAANAKDFVIHAGTLIDGVSETPRRRVAPRSVRDERWNCIQIRRRAACRRRELIASIS